MLVLEPSPSEDHEGSLQVTGPGLLDPGGDALASRGSGAPGTPAALPLSPDAAPAKGMAASTLVGMSAGESAWRHSGESENLLARHPSLDEAFDPAVRIVEHDHAWARQADEELRRIGEALGCLAVRLEHVGSTAVPGLAAKPILDLQVSVACMEPRAGYIGPLQQLGYLFAADPDSSDLHFFGKPPQRPRPHHLHVCEAGSSHEFRHLAVRDFLCEHSGEAARYAALKRELVKRHPQDRLAYIAGKEQYVTELESRALVWARRRL